MTKKITATEKKTIKQKMITMSPVRDQNLIFKLSLGISESEKKNATEET